MFRRGRFGSLRLRITLAMLLLAAVGSSIFAFSVFLAAERLEPSAVRIGELLFGTRDAGITPEFARVLRNQILGKEPLAGDLGGWHRLFGNQGVDHFFVDAQKLGHFLG